MNSDAKFAREFAKRAHGQQLYAEKYPFVDHLDLVYKTLEEFGIYSCDVLTSAYLHDVIEDTEVTKETLGIFFNEDIVYLVDSVTVDDDRRKSLLRIAHRMASDPRVEALKLADRLTNVRLAVKENTERILRFYGSEHSIFRNGYGVKSSESWVMESDARNMMRKELDSHLAEWTE